ncbi:acetate--CoA ligase family protein [Caenibius sp. WL]|uniref:acetate--CoA ligase family protein n=1 Tax=Caenibius sp. WL TaxID=2872646 RepID=UPI001C9960EC|nr:acetate--CoA ligase family protein [Caenibius sp. WL]QZP08121.1 acetate--CoA ligase family protein [Caenibius sp. WL]
MTTDANPNREAWSVVGPVQLMPGYGYGFSYPTILLNVTIPSLTGDRRQELWEEFRGLFSGLPDLPPLPPVNDAVPADETDYIATIKWFARTVDHLAIIAQLPIAQTTSCVGIDAPTTTFAIPGLAFGRTPQMNLVIQALALFQSLARGTVPEQERADARQAWHEQFRLLQDTRPRNSNVPRMLCAAVQNGIAFQELPGIQAIQYGLGRKSVLFSSTLTQFTPVLGTHLARNKHEAALILRRHRLPVPLHHLAGNEDEALRIAEQLGYPVVVKPADKDGGIAVHADLRTADEVREAYAVARQKSHLVLVEQFVKGNDYRLTVFRGQCVWAVERQPAGVVGDGVSTIQQLVDAANTNPARGEGPHTPLKRLKLDDEAQGLLAREGLAIDAIPDAGLFVRMRRSSNVSSGGMPVAVTERMHPDNALLAVRAAQALQLDVAGIDLIIPDIATSWQQSGGMICEINAQPQLGGTTGNHLYPLLLQTMLGGDGHIPVIAVLGGQTAERTSHQLALALAGQGIRAGLHNRAGIAIGTTLLEQGPVSQLAAGQMLSMNRAVDLLIFGATDAMLLQEGFPVPRIDMLVLTGECLERGGLAMDGTDSWLMSLALRLLAPAARTVVLLDEASGQAGDVASALDALRIPFQTAGQEAILKHAEHLYRTV